MQVKDAYIARIKRHFTVKVIDIVTVIGTGIEVEIGKISPTEQLDLIQLTIGGKTLDGFIYASPASIQFESRRGDKLHLLLQHGNILIGQLTVSFLADSDEYALSHGILDDDTRGWQKLSYGKDKHESKRAFVDAPAFIVRIPY